MPEPNPTVRQRELGARLRRLRRERGLTADDVAGLLLCSTPKISRIETGARRASLRDVRDLCGVYQLDERATSELMELAREAQQPGWWTKYDDPNLAPYIGLEQEAMAITAFSATVMPALLQTADYAEAIARGVSGRVASAVIEQRVDALRMRQRLLEGQGSLRYRALLDEAVLHRQVGGPPVMAKQLGRINELAEMKLATVQVIPFSSGAHGGVDSNFEFLEFKEGVLRPIVFVQGLVSNLYQERLVDIDQYRELLEDLRDAALNPRDSMALIDEMRASIGE